MAGKKKKEAISSAVQEPLTANASRYQDAELKL